MTDHVRPDLIPYVNPVGGCPAVDVERLREYVTMLRGLAQQLADSGADVTKAWAPISECYHGPGDDVVTGLLNPVMWTANGLSDDVATVYLAVKGFVDDIDLVVSALAKLRGEAEEFVQGLTDHWDESGKLVDQNNDLVHRIDQQVALYEDAERRCANMIDSLFGGTMWHVAGLGSSASAYGYDEFGLDTMGVPWGSTVDRDESCAGHTVNFVPEFLKEVVVDVGGMVGGLLGLVGVDIEHRSVLDDYGVGPVRVSWTWQHAANSWEGLFDTIMALGQNFPDAAPINIYDFETGTSTAVDPKDLSQQVLKSLVGWSKWTDHPGEALADVVVNIGTVFIGGGLGKSGEAVDAARGAGEAGQAAEIAGRGESGVAAAGDAGMAAGETSVVADIGETTRGVADVLHEPGTFTVPDIPDIDRTVIPPPGPRPEPVPEPTPTPESVTAPEPVPKTPRAEPEPVSDSESRVTEPALSGDSATSDVTPAADSPVTSTGESPETANPVGDSQPGHEPTPTSPLDGQPHDINPSDITLSDSEHVALDKGQTVVRPDGVHIVSHDGGKTWTVYSPDEWSAIAHHGVDDAIGAGYTDADLRAAGLEPQYEPPQTKVTHAGIRTTFKNWFGNIEMWVKRRCAHPA